MNNVPKTPISLGWLVKMAWRDSRRNRARLFLFVSSIVLGIAALVAIYSLNDNLRATIDEQAAELLGADVELSGNQPPSQTLIALMDSIGGEQSQERSFASMIAFPKNGGSRLAQVKALEGDFPYYGQIETQPAAASRTFQAGQYQALVERTLLLQYNSQVGDSIQIGELRFQIVGMVEKAPGQTGISTSVAPSVYIPLRYLEQTTLLQKGSRIRHTYYFKLPKGTQAEPLMERIKGRIEAADYNYKTVESQKAETGRSFRDLSRFLTLVGFVALLLGCIGVASAIHIYLKEKIASIALLRCLGVRSSQAFLIYLIQVTGIGFAGSLFGAALGVLIQQFLPRVIQDFLPVALTPTLSWMAIGQGVAVGVLVSILFALLPLVGIRNVAPLRVLRVSTSDESALRDPLTWGVYALILLFVFGFSMVQMRSFSQALAFTAGVLVAFLVLYGMALALMWLVRRYFPASWSYLWRQGLANLFRPNNQTALLVVSIGLGTALICTLILVQGLLLQRVTLSSEGNKPNVVLFDIQTSQKEAVKALTREQGLMTGETVPVVNMRLEAINGITASIARRDSSESRYSRWLFSREYRVTYRDTLNDTETLRRGQWTATAPEQGLVPISLEEDFARRSRIRLGDTLLFNVQGSMLPTVVGSLREVDWLGIQTNFLVVFPKGVLEEAPQFHVLLTRVPTAEASARFQQAMVQRFPNVSIIDLELVLRVLDELFEKIGFVIRFMAGFSILTGLVVLIASVLISKYQRLQESVLLRTLGASRRQILFITTLEYLFLGGLASLTGIFLALAGSWALAKFSFETDFVPQWATLGLVGLVVSLLTVLIGLLNSRGILSRSPLEVLRQE
jgi:putative ABC transport system permease protein